MCVQNFAVAKGALVEGPNDEISACVGTGSVSGRLTIGVEGAIAPGGYSEGGSWGRAVGEF